MTAGTVDIIITIRADNSTKEITKKLEIDDLESKLSHLNKEIGGELSKEVLSLVDKQLRQQVPATWKTLGGKNAAFNSSMGTQRTIDGFMWTNKEYAENPWMN